ncbi:LysR family transcriptional regulator [Stakelama pacifica]|uniref:LysR family transcriptional regulator n=1 Tax=Stakelama pacifica TaxID=517720 RepID=UPI0010609DA5|nr:LysR family transcriptional regulator [Stakelama pacifica]
MSKGIKRQPRRSAARPDFHQLETFLKVVETRSFANAARQIGISQPAVSQTIARLEEIYGADLFERHRGAPVALTPVGRAILPKAKLLLFMVDAQMSRAVETAQSIRGVLTIGFHSGLANGPLNVAISEFLSSKPDVELRIVEASPSDLYRQLNERSIDLMFVALFPDLDHGPNVQERLWDEQLVVGLAEGHPLADRSTLTWNEVSRLPIILRSNQGDLWSYRTVAARMRDQPFECGLHDVSRGTLIEMVRLGIGATILLSSGAVPRDGVAYRPIADRDAIVHIEGLWPRHDRNPIRHSLLSYVRKHAQGSEP